MSAAPGGNAVSGEAEKQVFPARARGISHKVLDKYCLLLIQ